MRLLLMLFFAAVMACQGSFIFNVTLSPSTLSGLPGATLSFNGSITSTDSVNNEFINTDTINIASIPTGNINDEFLANAPIFLAPSGSSGSFLFFQVTIPTLLGAGNYNGTIDVIGGADGGNGSGNSLLGEGTFTVQVLSGVPEPASLLFVAAGLTAIVARRRGYRPSGTISR